MPSAVRSYSKINLGLAIGPPRPDGFHSLTTLYQTLALHDTLTISARPAERTRIQLTASDPRVPRDPRNTAWKMVSKVLEHLGLTAQVNIRIQKNLPIQGGMGAGSANAAAALIGLERELGFELPPQVRLRLAAEVGSDVPLFLVGGSVLGMDRGQAVSAVPDVTLDGSAQIPCVIALPNVGVSTPQAFRDWDSLIESGQNGNQGQNSSEPDLHIPVISGTLDKLSRTYASVFRKVDRESKAGASGINLDSSLAMEPGSPEKLHGLSREQRHTACQSGTSELEDDLAENSLLALVRTGIENDFETVVFPQNPLFGAIKRQLIGSHESAAVYCALSGSGSALFGLYRSISEAQAAQQRLQQNGTEAIVTSTMPRPLYWSNMFAE